MTPIDDPESRRDSILKNIKVDLQILKDQQADAQKKVEETDNKDRSLVQLNEHLASVNARSADLMAELEETNQSLSNMNMELAKANAHAADLMAVIELKNEEIENLNDSLSTANARSAELVAEVEIQMEEMNKMTEQMKKEISDRINAERKLKDAMEELDQKNHDLDDFNHSISHDLKSHLGSIVGFSQLIMRRYSGKLDDNVMAYLDKIIRSCNTMDNMMKDLLALSGADKTLDEVTEIDMNAVVTDTVTMLREIDQYRNVKVDYPSKLPVINYNRTKIIQVITNLVGNAMKYMGEQERPLVKIGLEEDRNNYLFKVIDNGKGIPQKELKTIFEPFTRGSSASKTEGTGVGLSIVKKIIETYGGQIQVRSKVGKGSIFTFTIPKNIEISQKKSHIH